MAINKHTQLHFCAQAATSHKYQYRAVITNTIALTILFVGYLLTTGTQLINSDGIKNFLRLTSALILILSIINTNRIKIEFCYYLLIVGIFFIIGNPLLITNIIFLILITINLTRLNQKEIAITLLISVTITVLMHGLLFQTGLITAQTIEIGERTRNSIGFSNPNQVSAIYFSFALIATLTHLIFKNKYSFLLTIAAFSLSFFVFFTTDTRTSIFGLLIFVILILTTETLKSKKTYSILMRAAGFFAPIAAATTTMYITKASGTELDILLSLRPYFFSEFINETSISDLALGWRNTDDLEVDNFFLMLLSAFGLALSAITIIFISIRTLKMKVELISFMITLMLISIFESLLLRPEIPSAILFMCLLFSPYFQKNNNEKNFTN